MLLGFLLNDLLTGFGVNFLLGLCLFFRIRIATKKTSAKKEENVSKSLDICQNCGSKVIGEIGMVRCGKCYHTLGGPNREEPAPFIVNNREIRNNWQGKSR